MTTTDRDDELRTRPRFDRYSVYELVEALAETHKCQLTLDLAQQLNDECERLRPLVEQAKDELRNHHLAAVGSIAELRAVRPMPVDAVDGAHELLAALSGSNELHESLCSLRDLCNPDELKR